MRTENRGAALHRALKNTVVLTLAVMFYLLPVENVLSRDEDRPGKKGEKEKRKIVNNQYSKDSDIDEKSEKIETSDDESNMSVTDLLLDFDSENKSSKDKSLRRSSEGAFKGSAANDPSAGAAKGPASSDFKPGSRLYSVYQSSMLNRVISSKIPHNKEGIQKEILNTREKEFFYISPLDRTNKASDYFKSRINDIIMSRRIAIDIEEATADGADILSNNEIRIGQRASNDDLGIYMLVPIGWRQDKSTAAVFRYYYLSITETDAYQKLTLPDKRKKLIEAERNEQEYVELYIDFIPKKEMETREISLLRTNELLHSEFQGGIKDFDTQASHNNWDGWKSVIRGFKKSGLNMVCYTSVFRPKVFDEEKREKVIFLKFLFLESRQVKYHVLYDAMVKSIYWADAVDE